MKVQFDLRPSGIVERERQKRSFNPMRLLAVLLMGLFFVSSIGYIVTMTLNRIALQEEVDMKEGEVSSMEAENTVLGRQVGELQARERVFADALKIMQEDLPSLEVLDALQNNMDMYGIGLSTLRFTIGRVNGNVKEPDVVEVTGTVDSDRRMNDFCERLSDARVFERVPPPLTNRDAGTGIISFTLRMPVLTVDKIQGQR